MHLIHDTVDALCIVRAQCPMLQPTRAAYLVRSLKLYIAEVQQRRLFVKAPLSVALQQLPGVLEPQSSGGALNERNPLRLLLCL